jgi:phage shock protein PspC (stress-responsive transcriptional regulator)
MERRLYRSTTDRYIGGVCGGLAEYFGIDPAIIRVIFLLTLFLHGTGLVAYIVLWIAVRSRPQGAEVPNDGAIRSSGWWKYAVGLILIAVGAVLLINENWYWMDFDWLVERYWPALLILVGLAMILIRGGRHRRYEPNGMAGVHHPQNGEATL